MTDSKPASRQDSLPAEPSAEIRNLGKINLSGWELVVFVDDYCRTRGADALAALARQREGTDRVARLATFFSTAAAINRARATPSRIADDSNTGASTPKPVRAPSTKPGFRR